MERKKAFNLIFDMLKETDAIKYTTKFNKKRIIEALTQIDMPAWKYLGYSNKNGLNSLFRTNVLVDLDKPRSRSWEFHLLYLIDYKWCNECKTLKRRKEFLLLKTTNELASACIKCAIPKNNKYKKENKEKLRIKRKEYYIKNRSKEILSAKLRKRRVKERTPKWLKEKDLLAIQEFYAMCPENWHVDHKIPLYGGLVSGLHVLDNLQYLTAHDNLSKGNFFEITI